MYLGEEFLHKFTATQMVPGDVNPKDIMSKECSLDKQTFSHSFIPNYDLIKTFDLSKSIKIDIRG